jgi:tetratricopeptide (TPR) repeat protein
MSGRAAPIVAAICTILVAATGGKAADLAPGETIARLEAPLRPVSAGPVLAHSLATLLQPAFRERWDESTRCERGRDYEAAAALRKALAAELRDDVHLHWRIARDTLRSAEQVAPSETGRRKALYREALDWAKRGRALDPNCGECCLYEFAARARLLAPSGALPSPGSLRHLATTLEACLERPPTWRDGPDESELGNLYYGAATFYRRLPRSRWFQWLSGVRGNRERAVALGRRALSLAPERIDFHVELGASLLCLAAEQDDREARAEGIGWLERATELPEQQPSDATDRERARAILDDPMRACGDSRVGFSRGG